MSDDHKLDTILAQQKQILAQVKHNNSRLAALEQSRTRVAAGDDELQGRAQDAIYSLAGTERRDGAELVLAKYSALQILAGVEQLRLRERDGKVKGSGWGLLTKSMLPELAGERKASTAGGSRAMLGPVHKITREAARAIAFEDARLAGVEEPGDYADAVLRGYDLEHRIAAMEEGQPDRDALVAQWRLLP